MLQRARLIAGLALGWGLVHGMHAGALLLMPALLPRCGGSGAAAWWLEALVPWLGTLGTLASFSTQAAVLLVGPVVLAAGRCWRGRRPSVRKGLGIAMPALVSGARVGGRRQVAWQEQATP